MTNEKNSSSMAIDEEFFNQVLDALENQKESFIESLVNEGWDAEEVERFTIAFEQHLEVFQNEKKRRNTQ